MSLESYLNKFDKEIYDQALKLNKKVKEKNKNFDKIVQEMKIKKKKYSNSLISVYNNLNEDFMGTIYDLSAKLKKQSKTYEKLISFINNMSPRPERIIFNHGENSKCLDLSSAIHKKFNYNTTAPMNLETIRFI